MSSGSIGISGLIYCVCARACVRVNIALASGTTTTTKDHREKAACRAKERDEGGCTRGAVVKGVGNKSKAENRKDGFGDHARVYTCERVIAGGVFSGPLPAAARNAKCKIYNLCIGTGHVVIRVRQRCIRATEKNRQDR